MTSYDAVDLMFHAVRNAHYHTARRRLLERLNRYANAATVLLGTAVIAEAAKKLIGLDLIWIGTATATVGVLQLVFDFSGRARTHEILQRRYYDLIAAMRSTVTPTEQELAEWNGRITQIFSDEPPTDPITDAEAYNSASNGFEVSQGDLLVIPFRARVLGFLGLANNWRFETRNEVKSRKNTASDT